MSPCTNLGAVDLIKTPERESYENGRNTAEYHGPHGFQHRRTFVLRLALLGFRRDGGRASRIGTQETLHSVDVREHNEARKYCMRDLMEHWVFQEVVVQRSANADRHCEQQKQLLHRLALAERKGLVEVCGCEIDHRELVEELCPV